MRENLILRDTRLRVETLAATPWPQRVVWQGMHQDYCEGPVYREQPPAEAEAGEICVRHLLKGDRGHYGPLEHPQITLNAVGFPHSVMQQARTHRVGISFDVQSMRYTGQRILECAQKWVAAGSSIEALRDPKAAIPSAVAADLEDLFFLRPCGEYLDRQGKKYKYDEEKRDVDMRAAFAGACIYAGKLQVGFAEEHARALLPFDFRQHFVVSFNLRSALHFMDLRAKLDAQDEIRALCDLIWPELQDWAPEICDWYAEKRLGKARLSP